MSFCVRYNIWVLLLPNTTRPCSLSLSFMETFSLRANKDDRHGNFNLRCQSKLWTLFIFSVFFFSQLLFFHFSFASLLSLASHLYICKTRPLFSSSRLVSSSFHSLYCQFPNCSLFKIPHFNHSDRFVKGFCFLSWEIVKIWG